jgi:hypothetical protein
MWTETTEGRAVIKEISKGVVTQIAPEELDLFDELAQEYFEDPTPPDLSSPARDDALGFGLAETVVAVTPTAMAMVTAVLGYLLTEAIKVTQQEGATAIKAKIKALFNPEEDANQAEGSTTKKDKDFPPLTKEQLEQVNKLARRQAMVFGLDAEQAKLMANALIGSLALAK